MRRMLTIVHAAAVACVLVACGIAVARAAAGEPTGAVPSLKASVLGLRFFQGDREPAPPGQRQYDHRFLHTSARFIHWELQLAHPAPGRRTPFTVEELWYGAKDIVHRHRRAFIMDSRWEGSDWTGSAYLPVTKTVSEPSRGDVFRCRGVTGEWGPCDSNSQVTIGYWPRGSYRVDLLVDGRRIATGAFSMLSKDDLDRDWRAMLADRSSPTARLPAVRGHVDGLKLFDGGLPAPAIAKRRYSARFARSTTRRIGWDLALKHPEPGRWVPVVVDALWFRAEGQGDRLVQRKVLQTAVLADWADTHLLDDTDPWASGGWPAGTYRLDLWADGKKIASAPFEIR